MAMVEYSLFALCLVILILPPDVVVGASGHLDGQGCFKTWGWLGPLDVPPGGSTDFSYSNGVVPEAVGGFWVSNTGEANIRVSLYSSWYLADWHFYTSADIRPGEEKAVSFHGASLYQVRGVIENLSGDQGAEYFCKSGDGSSRVSSADGSSVQNRTVRTTPTPTTALVVRKLREDYLPPEMKFVALTIMKALVPKILGNVPVVGWILGPLVNLVFFPPEKPDYWAIVSQRVVELVDKKIMQERVNRVDSEMREIKAKMKDVADAMDDGRLRLTLKERYMVVAQYLIGKEEIFRYVGDSSSSSMELVAGNSVLLPMFSTFCMLKMSYYAAGLRQSPQLHLTKGDVDDLKVWSNKTLTLASDYVRKLREEAVKAAIAQKRDLYAAVQRTRSHFATHGDDYVNIMKYILDGALANRTGDNSTFYNDVVTFSDPFMNMGSDPGLMPLLRRPDEPLVPRILPATGKRDRIVSVRGHVWRVFNAPRLGGLETCFGSGNCYTTGYPTKENRLINMNGARIDRISMSGGGKVDRITLHLSDGRNETFGENAGVGVAEHVFEAPDHHIVGLLTSVVHSRHPDQVNGIGVSYFPNANLDD